MRDAGRERLLSGALTEFTTKGLAATRVADIAARSGLSQGLLYHYFPSKDAIFVELLRHAVGRMGDATRALEQLPLAPLAKLRRAVTELLRRLESSNDDFARYFLLTAQAGLSAALPPEADTILREQRDAPYAAIARILRAGQAEGTIRREHDAEAMAMVFWTSFKGLALQRATFGAAFRSPEPALLLHLFVEDSQR